MLLLLLPVRLLLLSVVGVVNLLPPHSDGAPGGGRTHGIRWR